MYPAKQPISYSLSALRAAQAAGVSSATRCTLTSASPGRTSPKYSRTRIPMRRQVSTADSIAATFGPACSLPTWIQFFRPSATGRIEFSAQLLLSSNSGYSRNRVNFVHSESV
jgi:hypothetical protein